MWKAMRGKRLTKFANFHYGEALTTVHFAD